MHDSHRLRGVLVAGIFVGILPAASPATVRLDDATPACTPDWTQVADGKLVPAAR